MLRRTAFSIIELLVAAAIVALLGGILFPMFAQSAQRKSNAFNLKRLSQAASHYSQDADEHFIIAINGRFRNLKNTQDGVLTSYGEQRSDQWPLILLPYLKDRRLFVDPERGDTIGIWSAAPFATQDPGYDSYTNTYRNQSRFPMYGVNELFVSPMVIPASKMADVMPTNFMVGGSHFLGEVEDPNNTVYFAVSTRGRIPDTSDDMIGTLDAARGFWAVNAPGLWNVLAASANPGPIIFWTGAGCSGDWCGVDYDPDTPGQQTRDNFFYKVPATQGNNVLMIGGQVEFMTPAELTAGTDYLTATPQDGGTGAFGGGANIIDKSEYLWNLNDNFYGA